MAIYPNATGIWRNPETGTEWSCEVEHREAVCCVLDHPEVPTECKCVLCDDEVPDWVGSDDPMQHCHPGHFCSQCCYCPMGKHQPEAARWWNCPIDDAKE